MPIAAQITSTLTVEVEGAPLPDETLSLLLSAEVDESAQLPDAFVLVFRDPMREVLAAAGINIGTSVTLSAVTAAAPAGEVLLRAGEVTAIEAEYSRAEGVLTTVRGYDRSHRAWGGRRTATYRNAAYSDVVRTVAGRIGVPVGQVDATTPVLPLVSQENTTDWGFLQRLAREVGFECDIDREGRLNFRAPTAASAAPAAGRLASTDPLQLTLYESLVSLRCVISAAQQVKEVVVRSWDPKQKRAVVGTAASATVRADLPVTPAELAGTFGNPTFVRVDTPYDTQGEAENAAKALAEDLAASFATLQGTSLGNPKLHAGTAVSLGLVGEPFDGRYTLTSVRHRFDEEGYVTVFEANGGDDRSFPGLAGHGGSRAASRTSGVVPAIVTDVNDPEHLCRVRVKLPWLSEDYETDWVRTVQSWVGGGYGSISLPEVNDEVLVAFEQGDIRRPYVLGGLFNSVDKPRRGDFPMVDTGSGKVHRRELVSPGGHSIALTDSVTRSDGITVRTGDGKHVIELSKKDRRVTVHADGSIEIEAAGGPGSITVKAAGAIEVSGRTIALKAQAGIQIDGGAGDVVVKSGPKVAVQGAVLELTGNAKADLKAAGILTLQGSLVKIN